MTETREVLYTTEQGEDIHVDEIGQWILQGSRYRPSQPTISDGLPAGGYEFGFDNGGPYVETLTPPTDAPLALPGCASEVVLAGIERFRKAEDRYAQFGMLYKRGILLLRASGDGKDGDDPAGVGCADRRGRGGTVLRRHESAGRDHEDDSHYRASAVARGGL